MYKTYSMDLAGRTLSVDIGRVGKQAGGCAFIHYGDTTLLCTATASAAPRDGIDFFPLSVEYSEKFYAVGKMPGGFNKREGKPRTLCQDIGEKLGTGAAMQHLLRTRVGQFDLDHAITLDEAEAIMKSDRPERIESYILPVDSFFSDAPKAVVREEAMRYLINGNVIKRRYTDLPAQASECLVRMYDQDGKFYALYSYVPRGDELRGVRMFLT